MPHITALLSSPAEAESSRKRKRSDESDEDAPAPHPLFPPTALDALVLPGMGDEQLWQQLELRSAKLSRVLDAFMTSEQDEEDDEAESESSGDAHALNDIEEEGDEDEEDDAASVASDEGFPGASDLSDVDPNDVFIEPLQTEEEQQARKAEKEREEMMRIYSNADPALLEALMNEEQGGDVDVSGDDEGDEEGDEGDEEDDQQGARGASILDSLDEPGTGQQRRAKHPTLDDDFFSIDDFNRMTEADERHGMTSKANLSGEDEEDGDDDLDLFAAVEEGEDDEEAGEKPAAEIGYADFFDPVPYARKAPAKAPAAPEERPAPEKPAAPEPASPEAPPRKSLVRFHEQVQVRPIKKCQPKDVPAGLLMPPDEADGDGASDDEDAWEDEPEDEGQAGEEEEEMGSDDEAEAEVDDDEDVEGEEGVGEEGEEVPGDEPDERDLEAREDATASRVSQDLFADDTAEEKPDMSSHERRMAALQDEISRYEDENVQDKDWTLMGEASVRERPSNSLLEEDLEFDRTAKVAPTVTQEVNEDLEGMIKRRILERQFDDVVRQRELEALPFAPSKMLDLSDAKSSKSLAELYEDEYQASRSEANEGSAPRAEADVKLEKEHSEISADLDSLFNKLDALSNAHFTPKAPKAAIQTVSNTPSVAMESALPTNMSAASMLAPEEVYEASAHAPAMTGSKSEMTPQEKRRMHNQLRQAKRKRNDRIRRTQESLELSRGAPRKQNTKEEKEQALKGLMGNKGVSVVGKDQKRRDVRDAVSGQKRKPGADAPNAQWKM